CVATLLAGFW
nr:immunoglobulin heavy chain junction region [Mus musculus]